MVSIYYLSKRRLAHLLLVMVIISASIGAFYTTIKDTAHQVINTVAGVKLHPIYSVDLPEKKIAFSFDATWGSSRTEQILQILDKNQIKTTFFLTNIWMNDYPQLTKAIAERGHELALHSANHPRMTELTPEKIEEELLNNAKLIEELTKQKASLFRPPFGAYNNKVIEVVQKNSLIPIQWSIDSLDWKDLSEQQIFERISKRKIPGAIILFHNDGKNTPQALQPIIDDLIKDGYKIVPISELIYHDNYYIDINGIQRSRN